MALVSGAPVGSDRVAALIAVQAHLVNLSGKSTRRVHGFLQDVFFVFVDDDKKVAFGVGVKSHRFGGSVYSVRLSLRTG